MNRKIVAALLVAGLAALSPSSASAATREDPRASRAVWIWEEESFRLLEDPVFRDKAIDFLRDRHVDRVFLYADAYKGRNLVRDKPELYRSVVRELRGCGIDVQALLGSYFLKTETYVLPEKQKEARAMLRRVINYNDTSAREERFSGVHFDIEPHMLDEWKDHRRRLSLLYLERIDEWMTIARGSGLEVSAAIPFWLDRYELTWRGKRRPMNEHVQSVLDTVVLMDYRDQAEGSDGIIAHAKTELDWAAVNGRRVMIGLETGDSEPSKVTFLQEGSAALEREMAKTERAFAGTGAFTGFVIHHLDTWMALKP